MASDNHDHLWEQIDTTCDRFELALQDGTRGSIADFLIDDWPSEHRRLLLRELLDLELEYCTRSDVHFDVEKYARQFASDRDVLDNCISRHESRANTAVRPAHEETQALRQPSSVDSDGAASSVQTRDLGAFTLTGEIARGAMGIVYRAIDHSLDRTVALKVIRSGEFASSEEVRRFQVEARAAALLDHPNIVPIYEVGKANGQHYFSMGLVDGHDLAAAVSQDLYAPRPAAKLLIKLACAVQYAHEQGILHRDLKPANVLIDDRQEPRLTDFGLAKNLNVEATSDLTLSGQLIGTPSYMAPEQARGELDRIGRTSDVYALGAILYFVLAGRPPHRGASIADTLQQLLKEEPVSPRAFSPQVDRDLETICLTCLAKEPAQRYSSCDALVSDLRHYLAGDPIAARPVNTVVRWGRWCKRYPARAISLATGALLLIAVVVGVSYRREMLSTAAGLATANQLAESRKQTADTAQFYRLLQEAVATKARHEPGWTWRVEELLEKTNTLSSAVRDKALLRETILGPATGFDLRFRRTVADDILAGSLAFSPDGRYFATGQSIDEVRPGLLVFETSNFDNPKWTFSFESEEDTQRRIARGDRKVDNGFRALCFSPDSRWLAAGTRFGKVLVYDLTDPAANPRKLDVLEDAEVSRVQFSHDGRRLYAHIVGQRIKQWKNFEHEVSRDLDIRDFAVDETGNRIIVLPGNGVLQFYADLGEPPVTHAPGSRFSAPQMTPGFSGFIACCTGQLVIGGADSSTQIFDLRTSAKSNELFNRAPMSAPAFEGRYLFSPGRDWLRIWDTTSKHLLYELPVTARHRAIAALDPGGRFFAFRSGGPIQLYECRQPMSRKLLGGVLWTRGRAVFDGAAISTSCESPVEGNTDSVIQWDCETGDVVGRNVIVAERQDHESVTQFAALGAKRVTSLRSLGLVIWDRDERHGADRVQVLTSIGKSVSLGLDVIHAEGDGHDIQRVKRADGSEFLRLRPKTSAVSLRVELPMAKIPQAWPRLAVSAIVQIKCNANEGRAISVGHLDKLPREASSDSAANRRYYDAREFSGSTLGMVVLKYSSRENFATTHDALLEVVAAPRSLDEIEIQDIVVSPLTATSDGQPLAQVPMEVPAISPDGGRVWAAVDNNRLFSWDLSSDVQPTQWADVPDEWSHIYDIETGKKRIYSAARNGTVQLTDPVTGQLETQIKISDESVNNIDIGPDETWMIVSGDAGKVELRDIPTGRLIHEIAEFRQRVSAQALSTNGRWLATGDISGTTILWERQGETFQRRLVFDPFRNAILHLAFSANGRYLSVVVHNHNSVELFDLHALNKSFARYDVDLDLDSTPSAAGR